MLVVLCTFPSQESALKLARDLVESDIIACMNLLPGVTSVYKWEGKLEQQQEVLAVFKCKVGNYKQLEKRLLAGHPYDCPEVVALEPKAVSQAYLDWING